MGKALAEAFTPARRVFEEVDAALGEGLSRIIFSGPAETLTLTENAQPALMAVSLAALRVLEAEAGLDLKRDAAFIAGHSLGEYSALAAAQALTIADAARLLRIRGSVPHDLAQLVAKRGVDFLEDTARRRKSLRQSLTHTDRLTALATELRRLGASVEEFEDGLTITPQPLHGATVQTYNDHRMAMSLSLIGLRVPGVVIDNPGCVAKTYPHFFTDLERLRA